MALELKMYAFFIGGPVEDREGGGEGEKEKEGERGREAQHIGEKD